MADIFVGVIDNIAFPPGPVKQQILQTFDTHLGAYGSSSRQVRINNNRLTGAPQTVTIECPPTAPVSAADSFFVAFQAIPGVVQEFALPTPHKVPSPPQHSWNDPIAAVGAEPVVVNGYKSNPANFPSNAPDNDVTNFPLVTGHQLNELNIFRNDFILRSILVNMDSSAENIGEWDAQFADLNAIPYVSPAHYQLPFSNNGMRTALNRLAMDAEIGSDPSGIESTQINELGVMFLDRPWVSVADYNAGSPSGDIRPAFDLRTFTNELIDIHTPAAAKTITKDKKFRWKMNGKWYVLEITKKTASVPGVSGMYTGDDLTFGWSSVHPHNPPVLAYERDAALQNWMYIGLFVRQGNDNTGPKLNDNGIDDAAGVNSTVVTGITIPLGSFGNLATARYTNLVDKYKYAL